MVPPSRLQSIPLDICTPSTTRRTDRSGSNLKRLPAPVTRSLGMVPWNSRPAGSTAPSLVRFDSGSPGRSTVASTSPPGPVSATVRPRPSTSPPPARGSALPTWSPYPTDEMGRPVRWSKR